MVERGPSDQDKQGVYVIETASGHVCVFRWPQFPPPQTCKSAFLFKSSQAQSKLPVSPRLDRCLDCFRPFLDKNLSLSQWYVEIRFSYAEHPPTPAVIFLFLDVDIAEGIDQRTSTRSDKSGGLSEVRTFAFAACPLCLDDLRCRPRSPT